MDAIYTLWLREVRRYARQRTNIVAMLAQPVVYLFIMGFGMDGVFRQAGLGSYLQFVAPGILVMTVIFPATNSGVGLLMDRQFGFLAETLVAPAPRAFVMLGRMAGVGTIALLQGAMVSVACLIAGFRPANLALLPLAVVFLGLIALVFAGVGLIVGSSMKNVQAFGLMSNLLIMPLFLLSGAFFPLDNLPSALAALTQLNPLSYAVDGLRSVLVAQSHFSMGFDAAVLISLALVSVSFGAWRFAKIEV